MCETTFTTSVGSAYPNRNGNIYTSEGVSFADFIESFGKNNFNYISRIGIKNVIFNNPATIVLWNDGTKTVVKVQQGDEYSPETGLAMCIVKKMSGNKGNYNKIFKKWFPKEENK